ncbi:fumarylacetoacetate hydrolase family protein [soil metagenome]
MKLIRYGDPGEERPGVILDDGTRLDTSALCGDYDPDFFADAGLERLVGWIETHGRDAPEILQDVRLGPPVARPSKIVCIGLNYREHARETNKPIPGEPIIFLKAPSALCGPNDDLVLPKGSVKTDHEIELAVVIGRRASHVDWAGALDCIAGYTMMNDYSERAFQNEHGGQWTKGKSCDTFAPLGPYLATPDELGVVGTRALPLWLSVNGEIRQSGSTADMIFAVPEIVSYLSRFMSLLPGDVISTGTPAGVGAASGKYLCAGDVIEYGIAGLGESHQHAVSYASTMEEADVEAAVD